MTSTEKIWVVLAVVFVAAVAAWVAAISAREKRRQRKEAAKECLESWRRRVEKETCAKPRRDWFAPPRDDSRPWVSVRQGGGVTFHESKRSKKGEVRDNVVHDSMPTSTLLMASMYQDYSAPAGGSVDCSSGISSSDCGSSSSCGGCD